MFDIIWWYRLDMSKVIWKPIKIYKQKVI
jgi:hypothetical protein